MHYSQFENLVSENARFKVKTETKIQREEKIKYCSFCSLPILISDIKKHTESHILNWEEEEMLKETQDEEGMTVPDIMDTGDIKKENMSEDLESTKEMGDEDNVKCSFRPKFVHKSNMKEHIEQHVLDWGDDEDKDETDNETRVKSDLIESEDNMGIQMEAYNDDENEHATAFEAVDLEAQGYEESGDKVKCSFCPEVILRSDVKEHLEHHVLGWDAEEDEVDPEAATISGTEDMGETLMETDDNIENVCATESKAAEDPEAQANMERVNCSFCSELVLKSDVKEHTRYHVLQWDQEDLENLPEKGVVAEEPEPGIAEKEDGNMKDNMSESVVEDNEIDKGTLKCSFSESKIAEHIQSHVVEWADIVEQNSESPDKKPEDKDMKVMERNETKQKNCKEKEQRNVKCSFCSRYFLKADIKEHIEHHVLEWDISALEKDEEEINQKTKPGILEQVGCTNGEDPLTNMFVEEIESEETLLEETEPVIEGEEFGYEKRTRLESVVLENVRTIKCSFCEEFVLKLNIAEHIHSHVVEWGDIVDENGESQYKKNMSKQQSKTPKSDPEKSIQDKKTLENTPETNKEDLVKCPFCEKFIPKSPSLEHAKKHVKTGKINNCQHCGKSFRDKGLLNSHERIHTDEKPFGCSFCEKKYKTKENLRVHIQSIH